MLILVDQDGVLADFAPHHAAEFARTHPDAPFVLDPGTQRVFDIDETVPAGWAEQVREVWCQPGFFASLPPMAGALEALESLEAAGHDVRICTAPLKRWHNCVPEKYGWVEEHLGVHWVGRMIVTRDKTLVRGDVLIDDKPRVVGALEPVWRHLLLAQPYNAAGETTAWARGQWEDVPGLIETLQGELAANGR